MSAIRVDTHAHVFVPDLKMRPDARYRPDYPATVESYLHTLSTRSFTHGVLVQPSFLGSDNHYLLAALATAPERLRGVIVIDDSDLAHELADERVSQLTAQGIRGIRLNLIGRAVPELASPAWQRAARTLHTHGWHLEIQASGEQWAVLAHTLSTWPGRVVIDHLGLPSDARGAAPTIVLSLAAEAHVWVKASAPYRSAPGQAARALLEIIETAGPERIVFGSDWPHTQHEAQAVDAWTWLQPIVGRSLHDRILKENPSTLFGWNLAADPD